MCPFQCIALSIPASERRIKAIISFFLSNGVQGLYPGLACLAMAHQTKINKYMYDSVKDLKPCLSSFLFQDNLPDCDVGLCIHLSPSDYDALLWPLKRRGSCVLGKRSHSGNPGGHGNHFGIHRTLSCWWWYRFGIVRSDSLSQKYIEYYKCAA